MTTDQTVSPEIQDAEAPATEHTYSGIVVEYSPVDAILAELRARYEGVVFDVATKAGMKDAKEVRQKLVKLRTGLEAKRKEIKEPALRRAQAIDAEAKAITTAIKAIEEPIDAQIKAEEDRIEAEKRAAEAKRAEIRAKIDGIRRLPIELADATSEEIAAERDALEAFTPLEEVFGDQTDDCKAALAECIAALTDLHARVMAREAAAALLEAERQRLDAARREAEQELAAAREALAEERRKLDEERAALEALRKPAAPEPVEANDDDPIMFNGLTEYETAEAAPAPDLTLDQEIAEQAALLLADAGAESEPVAPVSAPTDWRIRQAALCTAEQFNALAGKVEVCGFAMFATQLRDVATALEAGAHDATLASADRAALIAADEILLDATMRCIDALGEQAEAA